MDSAIKALFDAIYNGNQDQVSDAIHKGADVNACESRISGYTPLTLAFEIGDNVDEIVRLLCLHGADIHLANAWGSTPLLSSIAVKHTTWAKYFLARGAYVNVRGVVDCRLTSPLHEAAYWGMINMIEWLIQAGADTSMYAHNHLRPQNYARANQVNGPVELARIERALDQHQAHPIMSLWRHPIDTTHVRFQSIDFLEHNPENWTYRWAQSMKKKDWYNALIAIEMGAFVDNEVADMVREQRYLS